MQLHENAEFGLTTSHDDPYLMMDPEKRAKMRTAIKIMEHYCDNHPESPCALRHPLLLVRGGVWILLLGPSISEGIAGFGYTVEAALRAFDTQYLLGSGKIIVDSSKPTLEGTARPGVSQAGDMLRQNLLESEEGNVISRGDDP